ncbi:hypothetical protein G7Y89_g10485 [Cudoniella acicularis]|uniref:J domain-containing protein n=1 Tax=Cudoniella acicularis TaxID=354080 RepID=A0A8H4RF03_9HELO|nr:hypothetical protein G7Y89_g10485 [Cudoniella acicularis]
MRASLFSLAFVACFIALAAAWSKEDQEIFRLRDEVEVSEGVGVSFYDFLGISPSANQEEINKAYRKKSRTLHPDKVKQQFIADKTGKKSTTQKSNKKPSQSEIKAAAKAASDRFARLGIVTNILRGAGRERYDHFLSNGFPKWKGTGYYYARFRPGLGSVLTGLFIFVGGGGHWLALYMSWKRQQEFVGRYIKFARHAAWGDNLGIPGLDGASTPTPAVGDDADPMAQPMNRRQRRMQEKDSKKENKSDKKGKGIKSAKISPVGTPPVGATGPKKRVVAENGKILVVDTVGNVYLEQTDEEGQTHEFLLDPNELAQPTIKDTALYRVPIWAYNLVLGRHIHKAPVEEDSDISEEDVPSSGSSGADDFEVLEKVKTTAQNGTGRVIKRKKSARGRSPTFDEECRNCIRDTATTLKRAEDSQALDHMDHNMRYNERYLTDGEFAKYTVQAVKFISGFYEIKSGEGFVAFGKNDTAVELFLQTAILADLLVKTTRKGKLSDRIVEVMKNRMIAGATLRRVLINGGVLELETKELSWQVARSKR